MNVRHYNVYLEAFARAALNRCATDRLGFSEFMGHDTDDPRSHVARALGAADGKRAGGEIGSFKVIQKTIEGLVEGIPAG